MAELQTTFEDGDEPVCNEALPAGTVLLNGQYTIERYLSSGGFGITYFARDSLDRRVVIKECYPEAFCSRENKTVLARSRGHMQEFRSFVEMFVREAHSIAKLNHPNIVGVHQVFEDNQTAYMALDLIDGKDLLETIELSDNHLAPDEIKGLLLKVLDAISTVHEQDMLHRDISPDNILIDAWDNPVLIDFGAAREEASKKSRALSAVLVVKDGYSPQEFYIAGSKQTPCSDLYALAATFYHLISGNAPPNSQARLAAIAGNKPDPYQPLAGRIDGYELEFLETIDVAMSVFPQDRIQSAREWMLKIDDRKRREAALEKAQSNQDIENTVVQLILQARQEAAQAPEAVAPEIDEEPEVEVKPREPEILLPEEPVTTKLVHEEIDAAPLQSPPPARDYVRDMAVGTVVPKRLKSSAPRRRIKRKAARLVLAAALIFCVLDGQVTRMTEVFAPLVEQVMRLQGGGDGYFG